MHKFTRKDFLETLFQDYFRSREGFIVVKTQREHDKRIGTRYFPNVELLSRETYEKDQHVYFGCCPRESMKPDKHFIRYLVALWAGLDLGPEGYSGKQVYFFGHPQAAKAVRSFPLPPSIIVESGWGLHLYWLMREITPISQPGKIETLLDKINSYFQCKSPIGIDSLLRLPDTNNCKVLDHPINCKVKYINPDFKYALEDFYNLNLGVVTENAKSNVFMRVAMTNEQMADIALSDAESRSELIEAPTESTGTLLIEEDDLIEDAFSTEFEPVPYEETQVETKTLSLDVDMANLIAEKVALQLTSKYLDSFADAVAEKIIKRLNLEPPPKKKTTF